MKRIRSFFNFSILFSILFLFLIFIVSLVYYNNNFYSEAIKVSKKYSKIEKIIDLADSFFNEIDLRKYIGESFLPETKIVRLYLTGSDLKNINQQIENFKNIGFIKDELNYWRKAKLKVDGSEEKVQYKFHGTSISPLSNHNSISLRIKHKKSGNYLKNMRRFSLITYQDDLDISTISINKFASNFGLIAPRGEMVILKINDIDIGMYMLVEHHSKEWFEKFYKMTNYSLFKSNDDWDRKENSNGTAHLSSSDNLVNNKEVKGSSIEHSTNLAALRLLLDAVQKKDIKALKSLIDLDYAAKFVAANILANNAHHITGDNFKYLYDQTRGKFKFLFRVEDTLKRIDKSLENFNSSLFESYFVKSKTLELFYLLTQDDDFRNLRDKHLMRLLENKGKITKQAENTFFENYDVLHSSKNSLRKANFYKKEFFENLNHNFQAIENYLTYGKVFLTFENKNSLKESENILSVFNDSFVPLKIRFKNKKNKTIKEFNLKPLEVLKTLTARNRITRLNLKGIENPAEFEIINLITKKRLSDKNIYINYLKDFSITKYEDSLDTLKSNNINYSLTDKELIVFPGNYTITNDLIFPENKKIIFSPGLNFDVQKDKSIMVRSNFEIKGTANKPVTIRNKINGEPFGVLAVIGRGKIIDVSINNLKINGGSEASLEGIKFLGQISIHNANVKILDSSIKGSHSDDGINIRDSKVLLKNSIFKNNFADQIDLDFCTGEVKNNIFIFSKNNIDFGINFNGDGLDLSGSKITISKNKFSGFLDKALSIGEESKALIIDNEFDNNKSAITLKDGSQGFTLRNRFNANKTDFSLYIKKRFYDPPSLYIESIDINRIVENNLKNKVDSIKLSTESEMKGLYATN
jgi:hypothetical protein